MVIKLKEGKVKEIDIDNQIDYDRELDPKPPKTQLTRSSRTINKSPLDLFIEYVNHSRSPAMIFEDGRLYKPQIVKNMLKSFKKTYNMPDFNPTFVNDNKNGESNVYIKMN